MVPSFFKVSLQRFLLLMAAYSLVRLVFLLWNWPIYSAASLADLGYAFLLGLRFDTSAILFTNAILFLLWMLPAPVLQRPLVRKIDLILFGVINFVFLGGNLGDAEYVKFIGKRTSYDLLFIGADIERHSLSVLSTYWYFAVALVLLIAALLWLYPRFPAVVPRQKLWLSGVWRLAAVFLIFTGMRGGYQFKPLSPMHAYFSVDQQLGWLVLNTPFNVIKTKPWGVIERTRYFDNDRDAILRLKEMTALSRPPLGVAKNWNVVIVILESVSLEYVGVANDYPGYTPFLDELSKKSFYFQHNFANARRSIEGLPAILCGLPAIMEEPIITSDFSNNRMDCLPKVLRQRGYSTYFLHGAHNGSMHFDTFSRLAGFETFVGLNEYPKDRPQDLDQYWGVLDEPMLQYATEVMDQARKPTLLSVFTLSSHHPYYIPPQHRGKFPKGTLEIHESIGYADYSLRQFFKTAEKKPWFNNTIFVVTADHTSKNDPAHRQYVTLTGSFRVPLMIYIPGLKDERVKASPERITQHIDIQPTVLDLLGTSLPDRLLVGQSIFDQAKPGRAYNYSTVSYWYMDPEAVVNLGRPPYPLRVYKPIDIENREEGKTDDPFFAPAVENLKAVVHYFNEGLVHNSLYKWREAL